MMEAADSQQLADILIVSQVVVGGGQSPEELTGLAYSVTKADGTKCERCWKYDVQVGADPRYPTVCARCASVLNAGAAV